MVLMMTVLGFYIIGVKQVSKGLNSAGNELFKGIIYKRDKELKLLKGNVKFQPLEKYVIDSGGQPIRALV